MTLVRSSPWLLLIRFSHSVLLILQECRLHCAEDGRCLKWTIEMDNHFCWLKGEGGERKKAGPRIISGTNYRNVL